MLSVFSYFLVIISRYFAGALPPAGHASQIPPKNNEDLGPQEGNDINCTTGPRPPLKDYGPQKSNEEGVTRHLSRFESARKASRIILPL